MELIVRRGRFLNKISTELSNSKVCPLETTDRPKRDA